MACDSQGGRDALPRQLREDEGKGAGKEIASRDVKGKKRMGWEVWGTSLSSSTPCIAQGDWRGWMKRGKEAEKSLVIHTGEGEVKTTILRFILAKDIYTFTSTPALLLI